MKITLTIIIAIAAMVYAVEVIAQTVLDFTTGYPPGVEVKQASGELHWSGATSKRSHVTGRWYLPWVLGDGDKIQIDLNPRYANSEGLLIGKVGRSINRYTWAAAQPKTVTMERTADVVTLSPPLKPVTVTDGDYRIGLYNTEATGFSTDNMIQLYRARLYAVPTPTPTATETPTETPTETATETPTATATIPEATEEVVRFYFDDKRSGWRWEIKATRRLEAE